MRSVAWTHVGRRRRTFFICNGDLSEPHARSQPKWGQTPQLGLKLKPVVKGAGSVLEGINKTKSLLDHDRFGIDPSCEDLAWEMENYSWKLDKNDDPLDEPVKMDDDACDMARYAVTTVLTRDKYVFRVRTA